MLYEVIKTFEALSKDGVQHKLIKSLKRVKSLKKKKKCDINIESYIEVFAVVRVCQFFQHLVSD